jgi:VWFA-related protein
MRASFPSTPSRGACSVLLGWSVLGAAAPRERPDPGSLPPSLRVTARLVEVTVIAEDKQGQPVVDLTREDFVVSDNGRRERIVSFSAPASRMAASTAPEALPANTFTNRIEQLAAGSSSVTAILFDGLNTPMARQSYARQQILSFLKQVAPGSTFSLYTLGRGLSVLRDFTTDTRSLVRALEGYRGEVSAELGAAGPETADEGPARFRSWLDELDLNLVEHYARDRALRTTRTLLVIASHLQRMPGRKNLVWVSGSFPAWIGRDSVPLPERLKPAEQSLWPEIERAARALNDSNLTVYPVDARGLMAPPEYEPERASISRQAPFADRSGFATMETLAARTGGQAFFNSNDLVRAFRLAIDDSRFAYSLGYEPSHDQWNGEFRRIAVTVKRPGVRLRHRQGYFAQPEAPADESYRSGALAAAMWSPLDATRLGLTVRAIPAGNDSLDLELRLRARDVCLRPLEEGWHGKLDVWLVQLGAGDRLLDTASHVAELRLTQPGLHSLGPTGDLVLTERLRRARKSVLLRVLVRDVSTGALGSVSIPLDRVLPDPSDEKGAERPRLP